LCGGLKVPYYGVMLEKRSPPNPQSFETTNVKIAIEGPHIRCRNPFE